MKELRLKRILDNMQKHNLEQMIITSPASIFYLTGKWIEPGERMLALYINNRGDKKLFLNALFPVSENIGVDIEVYNDNENPIELLSKHILKTSLGVDKNWPAHFLIELLNKECGVTFVNGGAIIDEVRMIKDEEEINLMREASKVNDKVMKDIVGLLSQGYTEKKACKKLLDIYEKHGTDSFSFYPLIAYGKNAAEPHHDSDDSILKEGEGIILDIGGRTNMYCSDMTRTVFFQEPNEEQKKIYNIVLKANLKAIEAVKPGVKFSDIDRAARKVIEEAGYGKYFTHRTGHNIGIDVHEYPDVGSANDMIVKKGMIFSIEPGIYILGNCGVRIEDLVVVTEDGCEVLNGYTKELQVLK